MPWRVRIVVACAALASLVACGPRTIQMGRAPQRESYYSVGGQFRLDLIPRRLKGRGFEDDRPDPKPLAEVRVRRSPRYQLVSRFELVGDFMPDYALVSADGRLVVTVDGRPDEAVVIYGVDGGVKRRIDLSELLTERDIDLFGGCDHCGFRWSEPHHIDEAKRQLVLRVGSGRQGPDGRQTDTRELRIDLGTGEPLEPRRDLWPHPYWEATARIVENEPAVADTPVPWKSAAGDCRVPTDGSAAIPAALFEQHARHRQQAVYPDIAQRAKITGVVLVELLVSTAGVVECTRVLSEVPFLSLVAILAARQWTFVPFDAAPGQGYVRGRIRFDFNTGWR